MPTLSNRVQSADVFEPGSSQHKAILYVGCPPIEREAAEKRFASSKLTVVWIDSLPQAVDELRRRERPVVVDLSRAGTLQFVRDLRAQRPASVMFAIVDSGRPDLATEAVLAGLNEVFVRPIGGRRIINAINRELETAQPGTADSSSAPSDELYCQSAAMRSVSTHLTRAAGVRDGVLVRGEAGSGLQVVARAIHAASAGSGDFVVVDCAGGDPRHLGAELFGASPDGHNFGSRDFERVSRSSRLHDALGGTLYLRNIVEAPNRVQARLARVFRDREAVLVESDTAIDIDVRLVAGVTPDVEAAVREGRLRDDIYRRLSGICIDVPALRNRREDIPLLANCLLRRACSLARVPAKMLSRPALSLICALPWRGNGEELATLLRTIVDNGAAGGVGLDDVLRYVQLNTGALSSEGGTLRQARAQFERRYIMSLLEQHRGRMTDAAKSLGIQRTNLYRKMRTLKITRERRTVSGARAS
ncbi:MAG: hypothetical protein DMF95_09430 [Acidobacteria bacterium]|nr:MAG: hypothetical protein DMF94_00720 [Acidobacteriota bacterium]PYR50921.1 MAG: hypothetical protein DMF95_09430 [Acidobacteriota bacterium]